MVVAESGCWEILSNGITDESAKEGDLMIDIENRKYKYVVAYDPDEWVCFEMENDLAYVVILRKKEIAVRVYADSFLKFCDEWKDGNEISEEELKKAAEILNTAPLPEYSSSDLKDLEARVNYKLSEMTPKKLFRGEIKSLSLITEPSYFMMPEEPEYELEQRLTITAKGLVKVRRKIGRGQNFDENHEIINVKVKIPFEETNKILTQVTRYFSKEHENDLVTDEGIWTLKLTNTEGEIFKFDGSTCYDCRETLSKVSKLIRNITGFKYLLGFDGRNND